MNESTIKPIAFTIVIALLLSLVFIKAHSIDTSSSEMINNAIRDYRQVESQLNQDILKVRFNMLTEYGPLVTQIVRIKNILHYLQSTQQQFGKANQTEITHTLTKLQSLIQSKEAALEKFKSRNALLKNSLRYIPVGASKLNESALFHDRLPELSHKVSRLIKLTLSYNITTDNNLKSDLTALHDEVVNKAKRLPVQQKLELESLLSHIRVVINEKQQIDTLSTELLSGETETVLNQLQLQYKLLHDAMVTEANIYRIILYILAITLLLVIGFVITQLKKRSDTLRRAYTDLNYQKFALDQHSIVSITDAAGRIIYANDRFIKISQYTLNELLTQDHAIINSGLHSKEFWSELWQTVQQGKVWHGEIRNRKKDGSYFWVNSTIVPFMNDQGEPYQYITIRTDITKQKMAEADLFKEKELAEITLHSIADGVITTNANGIITYLNPTAARLTGCSEHEAKHKPLDLALMTFDETSHSPIRDILAPCLDRGESISLSNILLVQREGPSHSIELSASPLFDYRHHILGAVIIFHDVTDMRRLTQQMTFLASHDSLTGLVNRREFKNRMQKMFDSAKSHKHQHALCYIDLDQFKIINDTCGHVAGDELLKQLTSLLNEKVRTRDTLARLGGDEFGLLLGECPVDRAMEIAQDICHTVKNFRFVWDNKTFEIGTSIGVVPITENSESITELMSSADTACYTAKDMGRNRVHLYQEDDTETQQRFGEMQWIPKINHALAEGLLVLYAQPIVSLNKTGEKGLHYEVLIRMKDSDGQIIPPGAFIPAAERYNLMPNLDRWVITEVFSLYQQILKSTPDARYDTCSINLSGASLNDSKFLPFILEQLDKFAIPAEIFCFEITETAAISNLSTAIQFIKDLKQKGCKFSLDDFGSGLSSFAYLKNLPVNYLKIDGNFIVDMAQDPIDRAMVKSINQVGHVMGLKTIAEYIESEELCDIARDIGVDFGQGYAIGRPTPIEGLIVDRDALYEKASDLEKGLPD